MDTQAKYLELLQACLTRTIFLEEGADFGQRFIGADWPARAETMIGIIRMNNIRDCLEQIIKEQIPGDVIECGVWRGGACIWMKAILETFHEERDVYVADSFNGFPEPTMVCDKEAWYLHAPELKVSRKTVEENFQKYDLLDARVKFVEGFFSATLPTLKGPFALIRADGDLFASTTDILENLYTKLSVGGYMIIDDYNGMMSCRDAVDKYRETHHIIEPLIAVDHTAAYWQKQR